MPNTHEWNRKPPESRVHVKLLFVLGYRQDEPGSLPLQSNPSSAAAAAAAATSPFPRSSSQIRLKNRLPEPRTVAANARHRRPHRPEILSRAPSPGNTTSKLQPFPKEPKKSAEMSTA
ncbi:hypothetical protein SORBI_3008G169500 [Sorghum bicolor]|uniref:Uncharacterized protein n=1 Tax=Sorghum bicolor TaxID=4558 RepID=A0A1B6PE80_SORBI|nr:hypothetical protein SORBI_3008G169500 [Sorghum bicolor]